MCTFLQSKIKTLKFFLLAVSSSFPEMTFEDAGDVGGDTAGEMGSPLATERCLTFNHNVQYLDFVSRNQGGVVK